LSVCRLQSLPGWAGRTKLAEVTPEPLRLEADVGTRDRTTQETRSGPTSQHTFPNFVRSKRYDELSFGTPLRCAPYRTRAGGRSGHRMDSRPFRSSRLTRHTGATRLGVSRLRGLPEDSPDFPGKEILDELIGDLPVDDSFAQANRRAASQIYIPSRIAAWPGTSTSFVQLLHPIHSRLFKSPNNLLALWHTACPSKQQSAHAAAGNPGETVQRRRR
jgi:hypothetical protein